MSQESSKCELDRSDKRIHVALPIRVTYWDRENKPCLELACTYDISSHGARMTELRCVKDAGEIIAVERGKSKAFCRVVWVGEPNSELRGQLGIQCIESERTMFESELRGMEEIYEQIRSEGLPASSEFGGRSRRNRRRQPRFEIDGEVELLKNEPFADHKGALLKNLSETGCLITSHHQLAPGTDLKLALNVANHDLRFRGQVRHSLDFGVGIEFREIRKGDRQVLQFLLRKLAEQEPEEEKAGAVSVLL